MAEHQVMSWLSKHHSYKRDLVSHPNVRVDRARRLASTSKAKHKLKFRDQLKKTELFALVEARLWRKDWVVHSEPVGSGEQAFKYLAPYIFRVALSNNRIHKLQAGQVTFSYKESATDQLKFCKVSAQQFIRRFLQHVLPHRFIKVRYYGLLSPGQRHLLAQARKLLAPGRLANGPKTKPPAPHSESLRCPNCGGLLRRTQTLKPHRDRPP